MSNLCNCPNPDALESIVDFDCPVDFKEVAKIVISRQRVFQSAVQPPTVALLNTLSEWTATLAAADGTKTLVTPTIDDFEAAPGDAVTEELTIRNVVVGLNDTTISGFLAGAPGPTIASFKKLSCEKILYVYFITNDGSIVHSLEGTEPAGFKLSNNSFFMLDTTMIKRTINKNVFGFMLEAGWSDAAVVTPITGYDALIDLTN